MEQTLREMTQEYICDVLQNADKKDPAIISAVAELLKAYVNVCDHLL